MNSTAFILGLLAMLAVLGVLFLGLAGFAQGGEFNRRWGNKLMRARVVLQAIALALVAFAFMSAKN